MCIWGHEGGCTDDKQVFMKFLEIQSRLNYFDKISFVMKYRPWDVTQNSMNGPQKFRVNWIITTSSRILDDTCGSDAIRESSVYFGHGSFSF